MNKPNVTMWIEALRTGPYSQTVGSLQDADGFCCLGVACEIALMDGIPLQVGRYENFCAPEDEYQVSYNDETEFLPSEVCKWLDISTDHNEHSIQHTLTCMNDSGDSFYKIANYLEDRLADENA